MLSRRKKHDIHADLLFCSSSDAETTEFDLNIPPRRKPKPSMSDKLSFWIAKVHLREVSRIFSWRTCFVASCLALSVVYCTWRTPIPLDEFITEESGFHPEWHPTIRSERFPSIKERLKIYMSNWYLPPCYGNEPDPSIGTILDTRIRYTWDFSKDEFFPDVILTWTYTPNKPIATLDTRLRPDEPVVLWENSLWKETFLFGRVETCFYKRFTKSYCPDIRRIAEKLLAINIDNEKGSPNSSNAGGKSTLASMPPFIGQYGDRATATLKNVPVPLIKKYRHVSADETYLKEVTDMSGSSSALDCGNWDGRKKLVTVADVASNSTRNSVFEYSPIIMPLNTGRHLDPEKISQVLKYETLWERKWNMAVWRGVITGREGEEGVTFEKDCRRIPRCKFVRDNLDSKFIDAGVSRQLKSTPIDRSHRRKYLKGEMSMKRMLYYKAIIIIEGNDIASGLKWALYSRSVVMMAPPTKTSFAMEELLKPWVHYIPLKTDLSNAEDMMQWIIHNDEKARRIAERGTLFIHDLLFHADSIADNDYIQTEILERYMDFFVEAPPLKE